MIFFSSGVGCGGELYNYGGIFTSPSYPSADRNNSDCTWTINVPMNLLVAVSFPSKHQLFYYYEKVKPISANAFSFEHEQYSIWVREQLVS